MTRDISLFNNFLTNAKKFPKIIVSIVSNYKYNSGNDVELRHQGGSHVTIKVSRSIKPRLRASVSLVRALFWVFFKYMKILTMNYKVADSFL